jgi:hypothetical protein
MLTVNAVMQRTAPRAHDDRTPSKLGPVRRTLSDVGPTPERSHSAFAQAAVETSASPALKDQCVRGGMKLPCRARSLSHPEPRTRRT